MPAPPPNNLAHHQQQQLAAFRQACLQRFDFFTTAILKLQMTPFHASMANHILTTKHSMVLAPRGSGKSKIGNKAYLMWRIVKDPNLRICIASKTGTQATSFLTDIKTEFEGNPDLIALFGEFKSEQKWNEDEIIVAQRTKILKEPTILTRAIGAGIPGFHFDIIVADDMCDLENTATELQRDKGKSWFDIVLAPTLEPDGEFRVLGTRYNSADLYGTLAAKKETRDEQTGHITTHYQYPRFGPNTLVIPALTTDPNTQEETSFWPEKFTLPFLHERRSEGLHAFNLAYQNDAQILAGGIIDLDDLEAAVYIDESELPPRDEMIIFQGVDPAISQKQTADFFAHATIGVHGRQIYVLELTLQRLPFNEQVNYVIKQRWKWQPTLVGIETVAYQHALYQRIVEQDVWFPALEIRPQKDKTFRAKVFSQFTQRRELHLPARMPDVIETLVKMPNVKHDDAFDALDHAITAAKQSVLAQNVIAIYPTNLRRR